VATGAIVGLMVLALYLGSRWINSSAENAELGANCGAQAGARTAEALMRTFSLLAKDLCWSHRRICTVIAGAARSHTRVSR
jgi:hypothetical protein